MVVKVTPPPASAAALFVTAVVNTSSPVNVIVSTPSFTTFARFATTVASFPVTVPSVIELSANGFAP